MTLVLLLAGVTGLTGCSGGSGSAATSSSTPPVATTISSSPGPSPVTSAATGSTASSDKSFSVVLPTGWKSAKRPPAVLAIQAPSAQDQVTTNVSVTVQSPKTLPDLGDVISQAAISWRQQGITIKQLADRTVGGLPSRGYSFDRTAQGAKVTQTQYVVIFGGKIYTITLTAAQSAAAQGTQALDGILGTWAWKQ
ncbi:hypothetical protein HJ588_07790 [Flexivirga sp. ID2601S]|uniref:DUF1795 domain-containing protein n=1 Tax=Flexivirga aerilata TaxID=1656889 RepID=A0A849AE78_9MICO|nr:hypothetical protein [Flexivirga aerilata]NNG39174.1 hypothetical protein [Flexivirga aerilata]